MHIERFIKSSIVRTFYIFLKKQDWMENNPLDLRVCKSLFLTQYVQHVLVGSAHCCFSWTQGMYTLFRILSIITAVGKVGEV